MSKNEILKELKRHYDDTEKIKQEEKDKGNNFAIAVAYGYAMEGLKNILKKEGIL